MFRKASVLSLTACGLFALACSGCTTGVTPAGPNTYMISGQSPGLIPGGAVKAKLLRRANAWCEKKGLVMIPVDSKGSDAEFGGNWANAELTFLAVPPSEAHKYQSSFARTSDRVLEVRQR